MIRIFTDDHGVMRCFIEAHMGLLASFLEQDVQSSQRWATDLLKIVEDVRTGVRQEWQGTGNAHTLAVSTGGVRIKNEYSADELDLSLEEFETALKEWLTYIETRSRSN